MQSAWAQAPLGLPSNRLLKEGSALSKGGKGLPRLGPVAVGMFVVDWHVEVSCLGMLGLRGMGHRSLLQAQGPFGE